MASTLLHAGAPKAVPVARFSFQHQICVGGYFQLTCVQQSTPPSREGHRPLSSTACGGTSTCPLPEAWECVHLRAVRLLCSHSTHLLVILPWLLWLQLLQPRPGFLPENETCPLAGSIPPTQPRTLSSDRPSNTRLAQSLLWVKCFRPLSAG